MPGLSLNLTVPAPNARVLLPPLLACLSTASASKSTPPGLLPLLSPILRQRVRLLAPEACISLLSWDRAAGSKLTQVIDQIHAEPHPVSGEIEVDEPDQVEYQRSDPETLHARLVLQGFGLVATYLWCTGGEGGDQWLLADLRACEHVDNGTQWSSSMSDANDAGMRQRSLSSFHAADVPRAVPVTSAKEEEDDDGSYWAAYDQTPGQTPQPELSSTPNILARTQIGPTQSEMEYFARYASEVQPAMDAHDPDEETAATGESTLRGNTLHLAHDAPLEPPRPARQDTPIHHFYPPATHANAEVDSRDSFADDRLEHGEFIEGRHHLDIDQPRPTSSSASTTSVERLERKAESYGHAELAIKQHISTDIKSLFRLARASGINREEFEEIIRRELEVLPLLEQAME